MNILVTGGTGYFGRAFVDYHWLECERLVVYSRDEAKQAAMRDKYPFEELRFMIGDVRDYQRLSRAMNGIDVVIHASALKRIEVAHYNPDELVKTNIIGTMNVIEAAMANGVEKVVFLSTDKAYQPVSAYGQSKALAESLILNANNISGINGTKFSSVRYGNVSNSTGSVIPKWREILASGRTQVPVTDPDCTRFFMWGREAVDLLCETVMSMTGGELVIPDLPAYRLGDLAEAMGAEMHITGLPAHEKRAESMDETRCSDTARRMTVEELRAALAKM
jgi:UDP-N-acetylglucosamine 4,6-dehydratase